MPTARWSRSGACSTGRSCRSPVGWSMTPTNCSTMCANLWAAPAMRWRSASTIRVRLSSPGMPTAANPCYNAIVWQDARTFNVTEKLKAEGAEALTVARAGLTLDPYFSASKLRWIIDHVPRAKALLDRGKLRLGTSDSFFLDRLAGVYATDVTTASRTSLMNLDTGQWDPELCRLFGVPLEALPEIRPTVGSFGAAGKLAVTASICDQQAALFGHGCRRAGQAKITFGTGAFALAVVDRNIAVDRARGMSRTVAWKLGDAPIAYAIEGGVYDAASAINWARGLGLFESYAGIDDFAAPPAIERGIVFVPALSGLAAPYWDRNAAGMWLGLGLDSTRADMMQAMLEGIALLAAEVIDSMHKAAPLAGAISIDGGLSNNSYLCRFPRPRAGPSRRRARQRGPHRSRHRTARHDRRRTLRYRTRCPPRRAKSAGNRASRPCRHRRAIASAVQWNVAKTGDSHRRNIRNRYQTLFRSRERTVGGRSPGERTLCQTPRPLYHWPHWKDLGHSNRGARSHERPKNSCLIRRRQLRNRRQGILRKAHAAALCRRRVPVGPWRRRRDLRPFLRLEFRPRTRRLRRLPRGRHSHRH